MKRLNLIILIVGVTVAVLLVVLSIIILAIPSKTPITSLAFSSTEQENTTTLLNFVGTSNISEPQATAEKLLEEIRKNKFIGIHLDISKYSQNISEQDIISWGVFVKTLSEILNTQDLLTITLDNNTSALSGSWDSKGLYSPSMSIISYINRFNYVFIPDENESFLLQIAVFINNEAPQTFLGLSFLTHSSDNHKRLQNVRKTHIFLKTKLTSLFIRE
jgi:hypothetical protein